MNKPTKNGLYLMSLKDSNGSFELIIEVTKPMYRHVKLIKSTGTYASGYSDLRNSSYKNDLVSLRHSRDGFRDQVTFTKLNKLGKILYE